MFGDKSFIVIITLIGFLTLLVSYLTTIILLIVFRYKVSKLDKGLYSHLKLEKFFFLWTEEYKQFVFGKGYKLYEYITIRKVASLLDYLAIIGTIGFFIGVLFGIIDIVISQL